uniref:Ubiquitin-like protease family profile domain-containing protein n=1 Tax=Vitis vinifera TaxID=29760 RepID=A5BB28_VITVI|nr:hypothetical protein VITISV_008871 [Vitis vinifera]
MSILPNVEDSHSLSTLESLVVAYVFDVSLDKSELLVNFQYEHANLADFLTLGPRQELLNVIINVFACKLNSFENKFKGIRPTRCYLPTTFAQIILHGGRKLATATKMFTHIIKHMDEMNDCDKIYIPMHDTCPDHCSFHPGKNYIRMPPLHPAAAITPGCRHYIRMSYIWNSGVGWERRAFQLLRIYISGSSNSAHPKSFAANFAQCRGVINFFDYSLNQGAPAGHEPAETPSGHESLHQRNIHILDSLPSIERDGMQTSSVRTVVEECAHFFNLNGHPKNLSSVPIERPTWVDVQANGWDCGVHVINHMRRSDFMDSSSTPSHWDSIAIRHKLAIELLLDDENSEKAILWTRIFHMRPHSIGETRFLFVKN